MHRVGTVWVAMAVTTSLLPTASILAPAPVLAVERQARERALRQLATEARAAHKSGDFAKAAELYWQAWLLDPSDGGFLYGNARALHEAGALEQAITRYQAFLDLQRQDPRLTERAQRFLVLARQQSLQKKQELVARPPVPEAALPAVVEAPTEPTVAVAPARIRPEAPAWVGPAPGIAAKTADSPPLPPSYAWYVAAAGGVLAVAGGLLAGSAWQDRREFDNAMAPGFAGQKVAGYPTRAAAMNEAAGIAGQQTAGVVTLGLGVAVALAGVAWAWAAGAPAGLRAGAETP